MLRGMNSTVTGPESVAATPRTRRTWVACLGWSAHGVLRVVLALNLLVYGGAKLILGQMGRPDFADALVRYGEMSPHGLLWRFTGFSPTVQFIAGLAEVLAAVLLIWGRTAFLGALLGAVDLGIVFGLDLAFDIPVKQLALALTVGCLLVMLPSWRRVLALLTGGAAPAAAQPRILPWPRAHRVVSALAGVAAALVLVGSVAGSLIYSNSAKADEGPLPGVYVVTQDAQPAAAQLSQDQRWQQVAFGQWPVDGEARVSVRYADGRLRQGSYTVDGDSVRLSLDQPMSGDLGLMEYRTTDETTLTWRSAADGGLRLTGDGVDVTLTPEPEARYLFDRDFSWQPRVPVNR